MKLTLKNGVPSALLVTTLGLIATSADAALDPAIASAFTTLQTNFTDLLAAAYPVMVVITVGLVIFGMVKMFIRRSGS
jgi:hypothetical protein